MAPQALSPTNSTFPPLTTASPSSPNNDLETPRKVPSRLYPSSNDPAGDLPAFIKLCSQTTDPATYPLAAEISSNIPIYDLSNTPSPSSLTGTESLSDLQDEWYHVLLHGPGVIVLRGFFPNAAAGVITATNTAFSRIISREESAARTSSSGPKKGDHFASAGKNSRIWNSFSKHCLQDPSSFVSYYSNPWLRVVCETWLGPAYRITAQTNIVRPGGKAQISHRDYHLGFQTAEACSRFPRESQTATQFLTLQGAVAQTDMPLASGPTRFLPFSQSFPSGYMAYRRPEFSAYFERNWVSLPLKAGDAVFFNPALFHAAGENTTEDVERSANLLQISSAFGKTMESVDSVEVVESCWEEVLRHFDGSDGDGDSDNSNNGVDDDSEPQSRPSSKSYHGSRSQERWEALLAAIGEGYPFPTNLDARPPAPSGMAPESEQDVLRRALEDRWSTQEVVAALRRMREDSRA